MAATDHKGHTDMEDEGKDLKRGEEVFAMVYGCPVYSNVELCGADVEILNASGITGHKEICWIIVGELEIPFALIRSTLSLFAIDHHRIGDEPLVHDIPIPASVDQGKFNLLVDAQRSLTGKDINCPAYHVFKASKDNDCYSNCVISGLEIYNLDNKAHRALTANGDVICSIQGRDFLTPELPPGSLTRSRVVCLDPLTSAREALCSRLGVRASSHKWILITALANSTHCRHKADASESRSDSVMSLRDADDTDYENDADMRR